MVIIDQCQSMQKVQRMLLCLILPFKQYLVVNIRIDLICYRILNIIIIYKSDLDKLAGNGERNGALSTTVNWEIISVVLIPLRSLFQKK